MYKLVKIIFGCTVLLNMAFLSAAQNNNNHSGCFCEMLQTFRNPLIADVYARHNFEKYQQYLMAMERKKFELQQNAVSEYYKTCVKSGEIMKCQLDFQALYFCIYCKSMLRGNDLQQHIDTHFLKK